MNSNFEENNFSNMSWINCNVCCNQPNNLPNEMRKLFYLTSCGHIFCATCGCFTDNTSNRCRECKNVCSYTTIGDKSFRSNQQLLEYFQDPQNMCTKLLQSMKFQKIHQKRLFEHHQLSKYNRAKQYIKKLKNQLENMKNLLQNNQQSISINSMEHNPIFQINSTPFKLVDEEAKRRNNNVGVTFKVPNNNFRQSIRANASVSSESPVSGIASPASSSKYKSPVRVGSGNNFPSVDKLCLNSNESKKVNYSTT
ncbi:RING finger protein 212B-like isoform X2 [Daktulosphaira vitifoliae]|uniref:RING finger protein 212B-like isoform X2 n=1 Tax=Daktulosphaira vitifoliae TaxID=58002 RepID=UPI0021AA5110|nr:RING finger protein 212B-like isoform X2 [Daktulosphaira vitifoliae]